jgi:tetratricopeptide (TPR) repeat protein
MIDCHYSDERAGMSIMIVARDVRPETFFFTGGVDSGILRPHDEVRGEGIIFMKTFAAALMLVCLVGASGYGADWKTLTDEAVSLSPPEIWALAAKEKKSDGEIYKLTIVYYRQYDRSALRKLWVESGQARSDTPALGLLRGVLLLREHRLTESRAVLSRVLQEHPDFHPALFVLGHLSYLQKDFVYAYAVARRLIAQKKDLSTYHYTAALVLAAGAKGFTAPRNWLWAIPAFLEVTGHFREAGKLMPQAPEVLYGLGCFHLLTPSFVGGNLDLAIEMLERSRQLTPLNTQVYVRLAQAYRAKKNEDAYRRHIERAREIDGQDELLIDYLSGEKAFLDAP